MQLHSLTNTGGSEVSDENDKLKNYALGLMLLLVLGAISAVAQTGRRHKCQLEPQQQAVVQSPDQRCLPQCQAQTDRYEQQDHLDDRRDRWDDRNEGRFDRLADKLERVRERQALQRIRQLDRQFRYQKRGDNRIVGFLIASVSFMPWGITTGLVASGAIARK